MGEVAQLMRAAYRWDKTYRVSFNTQGFRALGFFLPPAFRLQVQSSLFLVSEVPGQPSLR